MDQREYQCKCYYDALSVTSDSDATKVNNNIDNNVASVQFGLVQQDSSDPDEQKWYGRPRAASGENEAAGHGNKTFKMRNLFLMLFLSMFPMQSLGFSQRTAFVRIPTGRSRRHRHGFRSSTDDYSSSSSSSSKTTNEQAPLVDAVVVDPTVIRLQKDLLQLATSTNRGFTASTLDRKVARDLIFDLANYNPTSEPASPFYDNKSVTPDDSNNINNNNDGPTLAGKWTLVYTDAPDITGLDSGGPWAVAKLGRIGQECAPPFIKNVIEWRRPDWAASLPFVAGTDESRILQKVVTEASATPDKPLSVTLKLAGIEIVGMTNNNSSTDTSSNLGESTEEDGLSPATWFQRNPLDLRGPLTAPFGQFEILYLDDQFRIIKTGQNFVAVNVRNELDWF